MNKNKIEPPRKRIDPIFYLVLADIAVIFGISLIDLTNRKISRDYQWEESSNPYLSPKHY